MRQNREYFWAVNRLVISGALDVEMSGLDTSRFRTDILDGKKNLSNQMWSEKTSIELLFADDSDSSG